ncbi:MAG: HAMP domain-containing sensor histidine kinase, partial [Candidatus Magasanikbacteria bacterium]|nr:HAMP domain-containing sensor histidine kinase [Candidatus Magasanikbacteria bacterium]
MVAAKESITTSLEEKEKYYRYERLAEIFTYFGVFVAFFLSFLTYKLPIDKVTLWQVFGFIFIFAFIWFRLIPKKYSGLKKVLIYYYFSILFIWAGVHFTQGVGSLVLFFFYLTVLSAAAALELKYFIPIVVAIASTMVIEGIFFSSTISPEFRINLTILHIWALLIIAIFGKSVFNQEKIAEEYGESAQLKTAKQIDSVKNEFVFIISNKLRQPILALLNYLKAALKAGEEQMSPDIFDLLKKTNENAERLGSLVNDLSDLSRIESQRLKLNLEEVNLNQLIGSTLSDFSMVATEKSIKLIYQPNFDTVLVECDPSRLHEIMANLIDNAIKYSPKNTQVTVGFTKEASLAQIFVRDSGFGIPEEAKEHLFEKFYRV